MVIGLTAATDVSHCARLLVHSLSLSHSPDGSAVPLPACQPAVTLASASPSIGSHMEMEEQQLVANADMAADVPMGGAVIGETDGERDGSQLLPALSGAMLAEHVKSKQRFIVRMERRRGNGLREEGVEKMDVVDRGKGWTCAVLFVLLMCNRFLHFYGSTFGAVCSHEEHEFRQLYALTSSYISSTFTS